MDSMDIFFYIFAALSVAFSLLVVLGKNPISSAFSLVLVFFCLSANYVLLQAHFIAAIQILVYAGAIMVLFIFVIMLLNADVKSVDLKKHKGFQLASALGCALLFGLVIFCIKNGTTALVQSGFTAEKIEQIGGNVQVISQLMFSDYILPFELTSVLLLIGIAGSVALAKRKMINE